VLQVPLQAAKVQRPALRAETLQRDRLLDWMSAEADSRVILVTAEAGYGKTTLLADFSHRTRRRVLWYRIDENDRSWVSLASCLTMAWAVMDLVIAGSRGLGLTLPDRHAIATLVAARAVPDAAQAIA
jgi:ATP/maltotriose-dependent transcriptional regulator MalT